MQANNNKISRQVKTMTKNEMRKRVGWRRMRRTKKIKQKGYHNEMSPVPWKLLWLFVLFVLCMFVDETQRRTKIQGGIEPIDLWWYLHSLAMGIAVRR
jgi:hypothetical protein